MTYLTPLPLQHFKLPKARTTPQNAHTAQKRALSCTKETPSRGASSLEHPRQDVIRLPSAHERDANNMRRRDRVQWLV